MKYYLDGQDKETGVLFRKMETTGEDLVTEETVHAQEARIMVSRVMCSLEADGMLIPRIKLHVQGYVVGYDMVDLIDQNGKGILDRINGLDPQRVINMYYTLTATELKSLIDAGAYTNDSFDQQLQNAFKNQIFTMSIDVIERHYQKFTLVEPVLDDYQLWERSNMTFDRLYQQVIDRLAASIEETKERPEEQQIEYHNEKEAAMFDDEMDLKKRIEEHSQHDDVDGSQEHQTVSF